MKALCYIVSAIMAVCIITNVDLGALAPEIENPVECHECHAVVPEASAQLHRYEYYTYDNMGRVHINAYTDYVCGPCDSGLR